jgi:hypothetical protein
MVLSEQHALKAPFHRASRACIARKPISCGEAVIHFMSMRQIAHSSNNATHDHAHQQHTALTHDTLISRTARRQLLKGADAGNERDLTAPSHA